MQSKPTVWRRVRRRCSVLGREESCDVRIIVSMTSASCSSRRALFTSSILKNANTNQHFSSPIDRYLKLKRQDSSDLCPILLIFTSIVFVVVTDRNKYVFCISRSKMSSNSRCCREYSSTETRRTKNRITKCLRRKMERGSEIFSISR